MQTLPCPFVAARICSCMVFLLVPCGVGHAAGPRVTLLLGETIDGQMPEVSAPLKSPFGVDFDHDENMFIVELKGGRIHRLSDKGQFQTVAGNGEQGYAGDGRPSREAVFNGMHNIAVAANGDVYISDSWNHCIRRIERSTGITTTIAGTGEPGYSGDGGPAVRARFDFVMCITLNPTSDKIYIADLRNRRIRVVDLNSGIVTSVAGNGEKGQPKDGAAATASPLVDPRAVTVDSLGRVYILERGGHALRMVTTDGIIRTVAGTGQAGDRDGPGLEAELNSPKHLCVDDADNVYIADDQNRTIRKYDSKRGTLRTVLGRGIGEPPIELSRPHGVCFDRGKLYVVDTGHNRVLRVDAW